MKKLVYALLFVILFSLSGCKQNDIPNDDPITILTASVEYDAFMEAFHERYPDIEVEFISYKGFNQTGYIRACLEAGDLPDIITTTFFVDEELQKQRMLDLSKYSFVNNYTDYWLNKCNVEGSVYLLPSNYSAIGFYYNKTIMDKYGWELPKNFEELKELSVEIEEAGLNTCVARLDLEGFVFSYLFGLGNTFYFNTEEGAAWKNDYLEGKVDAVGNLEPVLSYFKEWVDAGFISKDDIKVNAVSDSFLLGDTAFMLCQGLSVSSLDIEGVGTMEYGILPWLSPSGESNMIVSNVSRYYGLNKNLGEKGQEKRLENALRIMEFMSTEEGMQLLTTDTNSISPLNTLEITEGEMYYEIKDTIVGGNSIPLLYTGWDDIIIPFANELYSLMKDEQTVEECAKAMDDIRDKWLQKGPTNLGYVEETISKEDTAYLVGKIFVEMKNADAALISLGDFHGLGKENKFGVQCGIYAGDFHLDRMRTIVPAGTLGTITMRGEDIIAKKEQGLYLDDPVTEDSIPFSYVLVTNEDMTLEPDKEYTVVITSNDLPVELRETMIESWPAGDSQIIMEEYFKGYKKAITKDSIYQW